MNGFLIAFFLSFITTMAIIRSNRLHSHLTADFNVTGPQKFHSRVVPRIGGLSIMIAVCASVFILQDNPQKISLELSLMLCAAPSFAVGLSEDITKKISIGNRIFFTVVSSLLAIHFLDASIPRLDIPFIDLLFTLPFFGYIFTVFSITGMANAYNIIDGFHGLASMTGMIALAAIAYIGTIVYDPVVTYSCLIMLGAIAGFFVWNYPFGLIFLGDGGAYFLGFWIAVLSILLTNRNPDVSPWFAFLINGYPIVETTYSIYRRKIHRGRSMTQPDGIHFHTLIHRRITKNIKAKSPLLSSNAKTSPYLWALSILGITPAIIWWNSTGLLIASSLIFFSFYIWLYTKIVNFDTPKWLLIE